MIHKMELINKNQIKLEEVNSLFTVGVKGYYCYIYR